MSDDRRPDEQFRRRVLADRLRRAHVGAARWRERRADPDPQRFDFTGQAYFDPDSSPASFYGVPQHGHVYDPDAATEGGEIAAHYAHRGDDTEEP